MPESFTIDAGLLLAPGSGRAYAAWAIKPRGPAHFITSWITGAIIRVQPAVLFSLAMLLFAASSAGVVLLVARAAA
ncbi:MAG: hypothetical protein WDN04_06650 [Rhodospirillales bacterium]